MHVRRTAFGILSVLLLAGCCFGQLDSRGAEPVPASVSEHPPTNRTSGELGSEKVNRNGAFVGAPIPISSPAIGTGATVVVGYIFPFSKSDKVSPPSILGGAALFTDNGTRAFALGTELYFNQNRYHIVSGIGRGDFNYEFYGTGNAAGDAGRKLGLEQTGTLFFTVAMRRIPGRIFIGPRIWIATTSLSKQHAAQEFPKLPPLNVEFNMRSLGFQIERDTVPNRFFPEKGSSLKFTADFFAKGIGSTFSFQSYQFTFNAYQSLGKRNVIAYNAYVCSTAGNAPFFGQCIFGMRNELRGYPAGRYIDNRMIAAQGEFRAGLPWRLGAVAFAGLGEVGPTFSKFNYDNLLGSIGTGIRFNLSKKYHVNLRADVAKGKTDQTFSMGLGEAF